MNLLPFLDFAILQFMVELVNQEGQVKIMHGIKVSNFTKFSRLVVFLLLVIILFSTRLLKNFAPNSGVVKIFLT